ncbi:MAG: RHS repeat-associated core domain-containing protein, partial [Alcanivoracaceae bacterium]
RETKPEGSVLEYTYDLNGNKTSVAVTPAGGSPRTVNYSYDALNRLATATDEHGTTTYTYTPAGSRASVTQANGVTTSYSYDSLNRLTQLTSRASNGTVLQQFDYTLDATGHRTLIEEHNGRTSAYVYDDLYRLTEETITDPVNGNHSARYSYDTVGNRLESTVNGGITSYSYDANDRILSQGGISYSYDANGNTLTESSSSGTTTYSWDARNRLIEASTPNGTLLFGYDINGIRTSRSENGITTNFVVDHNQQYAQVLAEIENGFTTKQYTYGDDLLSQTDGAGQERFFLYDGLGTTRALADGAGGVTDTYSYEAFGELLASTGSSDNAYRYTGEQFDSGLNQYYLRARYYRQESGTFHSMDTWMGNDYNPVTLHKYLYANADPANWTDPTGNFSLGSLSIGMNSTVQLGGRAVGSAPVCQPEPIHLVYEIT